MCVYTYIYTHTVSLALALSFIPAIILCLRRHYQGLLEPDSVIVVGIVC